MCSCVTFLVPHLPCLEAGRKFSAIESFAMTVLALVMPRMVCGELCNSQACYSMPLLTVSGVCAPCLKSQIHSRAELQPSFHSHN